MRFSEIPGQEQAKSQLREMADSGRLAHAVMLSGPEGTGQMMLARAYAQYVHCESPAEGEPCGRCRSCRLHEELSHPDVHFSYPIVKAKSKGLVVSADLTSKWKEMLTLHPEMPRSAWLDLIGAGNSQPAIHVEEAAEIVKADAYPPYASDHRIFIIWLPERLRNEAANKLLKVIEEPSPGTLFLLVSDNEQQVLPTIFSRVQRVHTIGGAGIEVKTDTSEQEEFLDIYRDVMRNAYAKRVGALRRLSERVAAMGREKIRRYLDYSARMLRENFIHNMGLPPLNTMNGQEEAFSQRFSPFINHNNVEAFLAETDRARRDIERNANSKIVLFDYLLLTIILLHKKR